MSRSRRNCAGRVTRRAERRKLGRKFHVDGEAFT
jgi:hypothetical protein